MSPREQAAAVELLKRWRSLCLAADRADAKIEDDTAALMVLFLETEAFLYPEIVPTPIGRPA